MKYLILLAALLPCSALAGKPSDPPPPADPSASAVAHGGHAQAGAISESGAIATGGHGGAANAEALGGAGGSAAAEQSQSQSATASNAGNEQTLNVNSHYEQKRQAPNVYAPAVYASHSCALGWSIGASGPGAGISGGRAKADPACERREWYRVLNSDHPELALLIACSDPEIAALVRDRPDLCTYFAPPPVVVTYDSASNATETREPPAYVTRDELQRAFERSVAK